ncbi:Peptidoglycan/LPS O-acetylase OafA/YrhL, contains acyltransferase and SGNH-hydrolase domains [Agreia bicolorata]|uniref:Peptidoglycan/LPS O-acetylase OafA/YrhL, contains acyltransferase and SGNH-hydrolase domains n=1 Tax=Agreia bicolorata TaxID=110935 RepID=A0A1T4XAB3_9MICO|nr:acyltransferase [Agreia bicolorata]SKA86503.1 Peptidoglycan/LPS O-acetylase OafA/YrhL, contains acyltransferase and SGNH-hydrolase domains [Agreia bicolorata]
MSRADAAIEATVRRAPLIGALTGIRALAAFWVFLRHFRTEIVDALGPGPFTQFVIHLASAGYLGVDLFFILSGFILTYTHLTTMTSAYTWRTAVGFIWLRLARVWPLTAFVLMLFGAYFIFQALSSGDPSFLAQADPGRLLLHLTLLNGWFPSTLDWNGVDWSVSAEWMAYLTFAVGVVALGRFAAVASRRVMVTVIVLLMLPVLVVGISMQDDTIFLFANDSYVTAAGVLPIRVLGEFWIGAVLCLLLRRYLSETPEPQNVEGVRRMPLATLAAAASVAVLLVVAYHDPLHNMRAGQEEFHNGIDMIAPAESIIVLPLLVLLIACLAICPRDPLSRLLATRPFLLAGRASFAFYLVHPLIIGAGLLAASRLHADSGPPLLAMGIATAAAAWLSAWILWRFIEEPSRKLLRRMLPPSVVV